MKKLITYVVAAVSIASYGFPALVAKAGTDLPPFSLVQSPTMTPETLALRITAYASVPNETSDHPFITASGLHVRDGIVATNLLPFGTKVQIPTLFGTKVFTVEDRMNKRETHGLDIWMPTVGKAVFFGVHYAQIVILPNQSLSMN